MLLCRCGRASGLGRRSQDPESVMVPVYQIQKQVAEAVRASAFNRWFQGDGQTMLLMWMRRFREWEPGSCKESWECRQSWNWVQNPKNCFGRTVWGCRRLCLSAPHHLCRGALESPLCPSGNILVQLNRPHPPIFLSLALSFIHQIHFLSLLLSASPPTDKCSLTWKCGR